MEIYIDNRQTDIDVSQEVYDIFEKVIKESLMIEGLGLDYEVSISLVSNEEIKELNRGYRGVDSETDVLSFPMEDDFGLALPLLGDIIISVEKALEQAEEYGHSLDRELAYLTCHSLFHLLGYNHMNEIEKEKMRDKEKIVMKKLGIFKDVKGI